MHGVLLYGSRALGAALPDSDYDVLCLLESQTGARDAESWSGPAGQRAEVHFSQLADICKPGWWTFGYVTAKVLWDADGRVQRTLNMRAVFPEERRLPEARDHFDAYLNGLYRSLKSWRRADALGAHLHATDSVQWLLRGVFTLAGHWTPYWDRVDGQWWRLNGLEMDQHRFQLLMRRVALTAAPDAQRHLYRMAAGLLDRHHMRDLIDARGEDFQTVVSA